MLLFSCPRCYYIPPQAQRWRILSECPWETVYFCGICRTKHVETRSSLRCLPSGEIIDLRKQLTRQTLAIGQHVQLVVDDRMVRELWHACGVVTEQRIETDSTRPNQHRICYFVEFDEPIKAVGARLSGIWIQPAQALA